MTGKSASKRRSEPMDMLPSDKDGRVLDLKEVTMQAF